MIEDHWTHGRLALCRQVSAALESEGFTWSDPISDGKSLVLTSTTRGFDLRIRQLEASHQPPKLYITAHFRELHRGNITEVCSIQNISNGALAIADSVISRLLPRADKRYEELARREDSFKEELQQQHEDDCEAAAILCAASQGRAFIANPEAEPGDEISLEPPRYSHVSEVPSGWCIIEGRIRSGQIRLTLENLNTAQAAAIFAMLNDDQFT